MRTGKNRKECGMVAVEATIILPIAILSVILLLYLSLVMFQKANLQAGLETTLVYYKNLLTDTYVTANEELKLSKDDDGNSIAAGNSYSAEAPLSPYRGLFENPEKNYLTEENLKTYFDSVAGNMLFGNDVKLSIDYTNYVLFKQIKVTAVQYIKNPVPLLGQRDTFLITATARINAVDHDGMIRDADFIIDLVEDTKIGEYAKGFAGKISSLYNKMKEMLGVK